MELLLWIIFFSFLGGAISVLVASSYLILPETQRLKIVPHLISFATGTLLGAAFIAVLPHALSNAGATDAHTIPLCVLFGVLMFFILEKTVIWRHCHHDECESHGSDAHGKTNKSAAATIILIGDSIHNFVDGILIGTAFLSDFELGVITSFAVAAHEIPQELGDFVILLNSGFTRKKALSYNLLSSLATVVGAIIAWYGLASFVALLPYVLAITASSFIYVAVADLIPNLHQRTAVKDSLYQVLFIVIGVALVYGLDRLLH